MVGLAVDGLFSGFNTSEMMEALLFTTRAPAMRIAERRDATTTKLQAVQALNASVLGVRVASEALSTTGVFHSTTATSSNESILRATTTEQASAGSFEMTVQQLARAQQISSDPTNTFSDSEAALHLEGTIRINDTNITIRDTDSLSDIASRITNAGAGVSANVIEVEEDQFRLSIRSESTGAEGFTLTDVSTSNILEGLRIGADSGSDVVAHADGAFAYSNEFSTSLLNVGQMLNLESNVPAGTVQISNGTETIDVALDLATQSLEDIAQAINDAATSAGSSIVADVEDLGSSTFRLSIDSGDGGAVSFTDAGNVLEALGVVQTDLLQVDQAGQDAEFRVNGVDIVRSGNTVSDVIEGVTFTLVSDEDPTETVTVSVASTSTGAVNAVQSFIDAYNSTKTFIGNVASYDTETQQAGILLGDSSILSVDRELSGVLFRSISTLPSQLLDSLNGGSGVASGSIQITDRSGATATIDLSGEETLHDVIDVINRNRDIQVEVSINSAGTGLVIEDESGGLGTLTIAEMDGGTTAADLGILGSTTRNQFQGTAIAEAEFISMAQLGIGINPDGTLSFDAAAFQEALDENTAGIEAFFTQQGGFADQMTAATDRLTDRRTGALTTQVTALEETIDDYNESIESIEARVLLEEASLRAQFTAMEQALAQLQSQGEYLDSQFASLSSLNQK